MAWSGVWMASLVGLVVVGSAAGIRCVVRDHVAKKDATKDGCNFCARFLFPIADKAEVRQDLVCVEDRPVEYCTAPAFWDFFAAYLKVAKYRMKPDQAAVAKAACCAQEDCTYAPEEQGKGADPAQLDCYEGLMDKEGIAANTSAGWSCLTFALTDGRFYAAAAREPSIWRCEWPIVLSTDLKTTFPIYQTASFAVAAFDDIFTRTGLNATKLVDCCAEDKCNIHPLNGAPGLPASLAPLALLLLVLV